MPSREISIQDSPISLDILRQLQNISSTTFADDIIKDIADSEGNYPMHYACFIGNLELIKFFKVQGFEYQAANDLRQSPLHIITSSKFNNTFDIVRILSENNPSFDEPDINSYSPLYYATKYGLSDIAIFLLNKGADTQIFNGVIYNITYNTFINMLWTAEGRNLRYDETIRLKLNYDHIIFFIKYHLSTGETPLMRATKNGNIDLVKQYISEDADCCIKNGKDLNRTATHYAIINNKLEILKPLLNSQTGMKSLGMQDSKGDTPEIIALYKQMNDILHYLLARNLQSINSDSSVEDLDASSIIKLAGDNAEMHSGETL